ncbi:MAG: SRPBCC domain-containing protein [Dehalococcoidia bacterium]|nr:SRPBCC domain-containing protein [Dehalococcoidia bacterium]
MKVTRSEIDIDAPVENVWNIIIDLERYPEWNTFTPRMGAKQIVVGEEFLLDCQMTEKQLLRDEKEVFLAYEPERFRVCWGTSRTRGRPGIKSYRWQICEPVNDKRTHFINYEEFHGILAPLVNLLYGKKLHRAFVGYCQDLKKRAES